jgi:hypothetical protein
LTAKRGNGFRPLFQGLANLNGTLRFRSGDQALTMDGGECREYSLEASRKADAPWAGGVRDMLTRPVRLFRAAGS